MAKLMTTSDDDMVRLEYEYTPVEGNVADDRRSDEAEDEPLNTAFEPSDDDPEADNSRQVASPCLTTASGVLLQIKYCSHGN